MKRGRSDLRYLIPPAIVPLAISAGCVARAPYTPPSALDWCDDARPTTAVIGVTSWQCTPARVDAAVRTLLTQFRQLAPALGSPRFPISVYPMTSRSFGNEPLRLRTGCVPELPDKPDPNSIPMFDRERALRVYTGRVQQVRVRSPRRLARSTRLRASSRGGRGRSTRRASGGC